MQTVAEGDELAGRYVVGQQLGAGGSGSVWRAHDTLLDRPVAVKVVPAGAAATRLAREARATAGLDVPNVVSVYDVGEQDGVHYLVMELVDGVDLATLLRATGPLEPELAALLGRDLARGVAAVHDARMVHRDVTPGNVLVTVDGQVRLADLGIARRTDATATEQLTEPGTVVGTVDYLAPEQVENGEVTAASDVYAVGLVLHTALTGRPPFGDGSMSERVARRLAAEPAPLDDEVGPLADVVAAAVRREPGDRPDDGRALVAALGPLVAADEQPARRRLADRVARAASAPPGGGEATTALGSGAGAGRDREAAGSGHDGATSVLPVGVSGTTPAAGAAATAEATAGAASSRSRGAEGRRWGPDWLPDRATGAVAAVVLGAVAVVVAVVLTSSGDGAGGTGPDGGATTAVGIVAVDDHDPLGGGDEHGDQIARLADGDPDTAWDTEGYESAELGGLKGGVGFLVDLGEPAAVGAVELDLSLDGVAFAVTVSDERPAGDPTAGGTELGSVSDAAGTVRVEGDPVDGRWVAVWFTELVPDAGRFRARVAEVRVFGP